MEVDDKLREACELVAKVWLGWTVSEYAGVLTWFDKGTHVETPDWHHLPLEAVTDLASPWGMDLLLDAAEKIDGIEIKYHSWTDPEGMRWHRWSLTEETEEIDRLLADEFNENRYAALIYALDKVSEVLNAEQ